MKTKIKLFFRYNTCVMPWLWAMVPCLLFFISSCEDFTATDTPRTEMGSAAVFEDDQTATSAITGIYSRMMSGVGFASGYFGSITHIGALSADELENYDLSLAAFYNNTLTPDNDRLRASLWTEPYQYIYTVNLVLEGLSKSSGISDTVKDQLTGEAKFIRAFCYFYLVNFFGDVPLHLTSDYRENMGSQRTTGDEVYRQIILDLKEAQALLTDDYSFSDGERIRPNTWAATALLARVYLYLEAWEDAEKQASAIINNTSLYTLSNVDSVFLKNSKEAIWQLMPSVSSINTWEGLRYILVTTPPTTQTISTGLLARFETGDIRREEWIGEISSDTGSWYYPFKYKIRLGSTLTEYSMVFRLAEQYLVRAEARAQQEDITGAQYDLNTVRNRAGLENTMATTREELLDAIMHERRVELFTEWGHRWLDLKRTGRADNILGMVKPHWNATAVLFPIPLDEINRNPEIVQNPGY